MTHLPRSVRAPPPSGFSADRGRVVLRVLANILMWKIPVRDVQTAALEARAAAVAQVLRAAPEAQAPAAAQAEQAAPEDPSALGDRAAAVALAEWADLAERSGRAAPVEPRTTVPTCKRRSSATKPVSTHTAAVPLWRALIRRPVRSAQATLVSRDAHRIFSIMLFGIASTPTSADG